jgi:FemAB-related protein (PEP-CTERM system-associated)
MAGAGALTLALAEPVLTDTRGGMQIRAVAAADRVLWDRYVAGHPDASAYHEWAWRGVIERSFGHDTHYLGAWRDRTLAGVLPLVEMRSLLFGHFLCSLPFLNYGGVIADGEDVARALAAAASDLARRRQARHVELRHVAPRLPGVPVRQHKVTMLLPLAAGMWDRFDRKVRNQIRKAEKSGLTVEAGGAERLDDFYAVFARNMRDLGTPVYPRGFFREVLAAFPDRTRVVVVRREGAPVAAGVAYRTGRLVEVPWASSLREVNSLCPNHLLYWHVIQSALEAGCETLDFGRSTPDEGTFRFKQQWGARAVPLHWEYPYLADGALPNQGPTNPKFRAAIAVWKHCPLWLTNVVGPRIVRAIP